MNHNFRLWFKLCKKYNLVLNITFYNFKSKKGEESIRLPAKNFVKPINKLLVSEAEGGILRRPSLLLGEKPGSKRI